MIDIITNTILNGTQDFINNYIDFPYLVLFLLLTMIFKNIIIGIVRGIAKKQVNVTHAVFIFATVMAIVYWVITTHIMQLDTNPIKMFISYAIGTTFYEVIIEFIENQISRWRKTWKG